MPPEILDLDAQSTTPLAPEALAAMVRQPHWNPHSPHRGGRLAKAALEAARVQVAALLGRDPSGLLFTSGATEANNLALKGILEKHPGKRLITFATEHSCVLESARHVPNPVTILPVEPNGLPNRAAYTAALSGKDGGPDVALVSAMLINNEIGSIWPIGELAAEAHAHGALFHTDAAQAFAKIPIPDGPDLISLSAHKMHGPKGIGALWLAPHTPITPQMDGGLQEHDIRSGTQSPALAAGFGAAASLADPAATRAHAEALMAIALEALHPIPHSLNGPAPLTPQRWPGNLSITFPGEDSSRLIARLPGLALSSGAACSSASNRPSHVLAALGLPATAARQTLRLGWSTATTAETLREALAQLVSALK
ncbi:cysteine desulfurase family protein [Sandaracinobacteroides hominis]|uniref:cysteine desulfurase family protein n=1 Tax=Sandaracinobacteroides hominis TaxID=2780086 RepID=UPI0018F2C7B1|nr:aminotransferase class V-fold PLP-dependent enzyme [Sandaracinobacteroides hominis]